MDEVVKEVKMGMRSGIRGREGMEITWLFANDLEVRGNLEEDLRVMVEPFVELFKRRGL